MGDVCRQPTDHSTVIGMEETAWVLAPTSIHTRQAETVDVSELWMLSGVAWVNCTVRLRIGCLPPHRRMVRQTGKLVVNVSVLRLSPGIGM